MPDKTLTADERQSLRRVLDRSEPVSMLIHADGQTMSFYAVGTRLEARIETQGA